MAKFAAACLLLAILSPLAHAGLNFEPYAGGGYGTWNMDRTKSAVEMELGGNSVNVAYGARLTWSFTYLFLGLDFQYDSVLWRYQKMAAYAVDDSWNISSKGVETGSGPLIGLKTAGGGFSVWVSLFSDDRLKFSSELDPAEPAPIYQGRSTNVGASIALAHYLRFGVEYEMKRFGRMGQNGQLIGLPGSGAGGSNFAPLTYNVIFAFASVPLELF